MTNNAAQYIVSFPIKLLGTASDAQISVALDTLEVSTLLSMRRIFGPDPAFSISHKDLQQLASGILAMQNSASLLDALPAASEQHQLHCRVGGAEAVATLMTGKPARLSVSIGRFHWHGELSTFSTKDFDEVIAETERMTKLAQDKVQVCKKR